MSLGVGRLHTEQPFTILKQSFLQSRAEKECNTKQAPVVLPERAEGLCWLLTLRACRFAVSGPLQWLPGQYCPTRSAGSPESFDGASLVLSRVVGGEPLHFIAKLMVTFFF